MAASVTRGQTIALLPNAPPTKRVITRTLVGGRPSSAATVSWVAVIPMVESYRVSSSSSQTAVVADGSIGLWWLAANRYVCSIRTGAAARPASTSPRSIRPGSRPPKIRAGS
jgi:hypothetical protein